MIKIILDPEATACVTVRAGAFLKADAFASLLGFMTFVAAAMQPLLDDVPCKGGGERIALLRLILVSWAVLDFSTMIPVETMRRSPSCGVERVRSISNKGGERSSVVPFSLSPAGPAKFPISRSLSYLDR
jgi:hypothetical protein